MNQKAGTLPTYVLFIYLFIFGIGSYPPPNEMKKNTTSKIPLQNYRLEDWVLKVNLNQEKFDLSFQTKNLLIVLLDHFS